MAFIHLSLFLEDTLMEQEESAVDKDRLEKHRLNNNVGVKTKFLGEFLSLCVASNEKVLVFSQFIRPLSLIIDQLKLVLKWTEDEKILYIYGKVKNRQSLIHIFNDADNQVEILLASKKLVPSKKLLLMHGEFPLCCLHN
ncbi:SNF2 domain-containing protein CLASSY [Trifolium repens]|nr:SNF2 domain-containing protein CLASSY [Trifolium repens]